jgi:succinyl-CoA synthetase beta subunit
MVTEAEGRDVLARIGLPIVAGRACAGVAEVVRVAQDLAGPLVLKLSAPGVGHRERLGGVRLGLTGAAALRRAATEIAASAEAAGIAATDVGFLVEEQVLGPEVLVGAVRDPVAGPTLTVAVGGWAAEAGATFGTVVLPATPAEFAGAADRWRLPHLLGERRTAELVGLLAAVADEFVGGALAGYRTVELNPVVLSAAGPRVVDVLMIV